MEWTDVAFDYWVRQYRTTLTVGAGNDGSYIASPGKARNVITVGAYDDHNTISWAGDTVWTFSDYVNPQLYSGTQDREKPELVAPGVGIRMIDTNNNPVWPIPNGTSYAAPQVAGLAALLMQRNSDLVTLPNAVKAILMASAVHNIEGYPDFRSDPAIPDIRDGAGAIAGTFADTTAQVRANVNDTCSNSCWWNVAITDTVFTQQGGAMLPLHFEAAAGNRVRVAISWWAQSVATPIPIWWAGDWHYMGNVLSINLDLVVRDPTGQEVTHSATFSNNYELVDFLAQRSGVYTIEVWRTSSSDTTNEVGVAFTQLHQIYLPLIGKNF